MNNTKTISILHVVLLTMTFIGLKNHVTIIPSLLQTVGRDGWASVILGAIMLFPWLFVLVFVHTKSKQQPIKDWLKQKIGKVGSSIILYATAIYLMVVAAFTMRETVLWINTAFLPKTPIEILLLIYTVLCIFLASTSILTITIVNAFVLFAVLVFGFFVAFVNLQVKDYELLRPFFEHGWQPILKGMFYPASGFVELFLLLFIQQYVNKPIRWYHFGLMLFLLVGLTMGPLIGAIAEFGPVEAAKQRFPAYEEWGLATIGRYIEHLDFLSVYQWLTGAFIRISLILFIVTELLNAEGNQKKIWNFIAPPFYFICLLLALLSDNVFLEINEKYFLLINFIVLSTLSLLFMLIAFMKGKTSKKT